MTVYAVRKRGGQWTVCATHAVVMFFESYEEALEIARTAAGVIAHCAQPASEAPEARPQGRSFPLGFRRMTLKDHYGNQVP